MSAQAGPRKKRVDNANEVRLVGRLSRVAETRELPSGDGVVTFRISVDRDNPGTASRQKVDSVPCAAWDARSRRTVTGWEIGDLVEISGSVRCRFFRSGRGLGSRVEVEVSSARIIRRGSIA